MSDPVYKREDVERTLEKIVGLLNKLPGDWIVINFKDTPNKLECRRCGATDEMRTGISLSYWINLSYAFRMTHALCGLEEETALPGCDHTEKGLRRYSMDNYSGANLFCESCKTWFTDQYELGKIVPAR